MHHNEIEVIESPSHGIPRGTWIAESMFFIRRHLIPFCFHTYALEQHYDILHVFESFPELEPEFNAVGSPGVPGVRFIHVLTNKYYNVWKSVMLLHVLLIVKVLVL